MIWLTQKPVIILNITSAGGGLFGVEGTIRLSSLSGALGTVRDDRVG